MAAEIDDDANENLQRQKDEIEALEAIFGDEFIPLSGTENVSHLEEFSFDIRLGDAILRVKFPRDYPNVSATGISVRPATEPCEMFLSRAQCKALTESAIAFAAENQGSEVVYSLVETLKSDMDLLSRTCFRKSNPGDESASTERALLLIILIDHMNDSRAYTKKLAGWAKNLRLTGVQLFRRPEGKVRRKQRTEDVLVLLHGDGDGIAEWLCRLRTQKVDVNSRGNPCKERKSTVLAQVDAKAAPRVLLQGSSSGHYETVQYASLQDIEHFFSQSGLEDHLDVLSSLSL